VPIINKKTTETVIKVTEESSLKKRSKSSEDSHSHCKDAESRNVNSRTPGRSVSNERGGGSVNIETTQSVINTSPSINYSKSRIKTGRTRTAKINRLKPTSTSSDIKSTLNEDGIK